MSEQTTDVSDVNDKASGFVDSKGMVSHESYQKALTQRKADQAAKAAAEAEAKELRDKLNQIEEQGLVEQNKYKELYEKKTEEYQGLNQKFDGLKDSIVRAENIYEFEKVAGAPLKHEAFYDHINFSGIVRDDAGNIDQESLNTVVGDFRNTFGDSLFNIKQAKALPSGASKEAPTKGFKDLSSDEIKAKLRELGQ